jgi:hypothetical protein
VTLLRIAARHQLVTVDLNSSTVYPPAQGEPVGVQAGDGTRLGALTRDRLATLIATLSLPDPWLVLERLPQRYIQTQRRDDGAFTLEVRLGSADQHFQTTIPDAPSTVALMWSWVLAEPDWDSGIRWTRLEF